MLLRKEMQKMKKDELIRRLDVYFSEDTPIPREVDFLRAVDIQAKGTIGIGLEWDERARLTAIRENNRKGSPLKVLSLVNFNNSYDRQIREGMLCGLRDSKYYKRFEHFRVLLDLLETADEKMSRYENDYARFRRFVITPIGE